MGSIKSIRFAWGSALYVHDVAHQSAIDEKHGFSAHLFVVDEAQSLSTLSSVLGQLVLPVLQDHDGQIVLVGTPGRELHSKFHALASGDDPDWTVTRCYSWDNPKIGSTDQERWANIMARTIRPGRSQYMLSLEDIEKLDRLSRDERVAIAEGTYHDREWIKTLDPDFQRQFFGAWVSGGVQWVYEWHRAPESFYYARTTDCLYNERDERSLPTVDASMESRLLLLPNKPTNGRPRDWKAVIGLDLGFAKPTAWSAVLYSEGLEASYVLWSETAVELADDEILTRTAGIVEDLKRCGVRVLRVVADLNGMRLGTHKQWSADFARRFRIPAEGPHGTPIVMAHKPDKYEQIRVMNMDIRAERLRIIAGDALDIEGRHLRWKEGTGSQGHAKIDKDRIIALADGSLIQPGDHALDATRYACYHVPFMFARTEETPQTPEEYRAMEVRNRRIRAMSGQL